MRILTGHRRMVYSVRFSRDGRLLLSTGGFATEEARLFDLATGAVRWAFKEQHPKRFHGAALCPGGARLLTCEHPAGCRLLAVDSLEELPLPFGEQAVCPYAYPDFSPDGNRMLAWAEPNVPGPRIHWWEYPSWRPLPTWTVEIEWAFRYFHPVFSPDGRTLADVARGGVVLYDVATGEERRRFPVAVKGGQLAVAFDPACRLLAAASGVWLAVWDTTTGEQVTAFRQQKKHFLGVAFTDDGRHLGTVSNEATVKLWDTSSWRLDREYAWQAGGLKCLAFSADGMLAAAGSDKNRIVLWDMDD
jgi:WD40 repeat protein